MKPVIFRMILCTLCIFSASSNLISQAPTPFACTGSDGFGYYIASETETITGTSPNSTVLYSNSRLSKITTSTGARVTICASTSPGISVSMNGLAFNPHDNFLYAVSRYSANPNYSGKLYRIGGNCVKKELTVSGAIQKFTTNNPTTVDASGGNIGSGTFDLDNHYYANTSFTNVASTGYTNKLQKILINGDNATVLNTVNLTCSTCTAGEVQINDIIFDEASGKLIGSNARNNRLYSIHPTSGVMTLIGTTGITNPVLGMYKNRDGLVRAIDNTGKIYSVNIMGATNNFTLLATATDFRSKNADAASGCYAPPSISGNVFLDDDRLTDNTVDGMGTNMAGSSPIYANLMQNNIVLKTAIINSQGYYQFLGLFTGAYEVQIGTIIGTKGNAAPSQSLPSNYVFVGDNIGAGPGNDGSPNGRLSVSVSNGVDVNEVNFGIDIESIVPIELVAFKGKLRGNNAIIGWTTANEVENDYFILERRTDRGEFSEIFRIKGQAFSNQVIDYEYIDKNIHGDNYYRLRQIDINGSEFVSKHILVAASERKFEIYPTVTEGKVYFKTSTEIDGYEIQVVNIEGNSITKIKIEDGLSEIDLSNYSAGIYFLMITNKEREFIAEKRIIKID